ncbi:uncharacterized protein LOC134726504 [Mytilus trossulus]|uniref:uncharacterized protein LOC134726504 n=1 Tax=Mytilus trossulus TaxID=6551 RepID=UPI0030042A08
MKSHYAEYILIFTFLVPQVWTEYSYICGKKSSNLKCNQNETVDINYVNFRLWRNGCPTAEDTSCRNQTRLIKEKCSTRQNCSLGESDFNSCNKQPRRVFVELYCIKKRRWFDRQYTKTVEVCGSLSVIHCDGKDVISGSVFWLYKIEATCEDVKEISNCIAKILHLCVGYRSCDLINVNTDCFYLTLRAPITYSCNGGTGSPTTTVNYAGNNSYFDKEDVSPSTIVFDMIKPPNTGEIEFVLDVDSDFRLLMINKKRNTTYSLCANKWKNEYARFVCRHLNISDDGIAGDIRRSTKLSRIGYGVDCPVDITDLFECRPDNTNDSREICDSIGDATVKCYNLCIKSIAGGASLFAIIIIFLLVIIYIQRRKLIKASYTTLTVRRDENNYNEIPHQMSDHMAEHYYEESPLSVIPTSEGQSAAHQKINQIQHVDTSGCLIPSDIMETGGDHYQSIAN